MSNSFVIGFVGGDSYDVMFYLGRLLGGLGMRALLIDDSYNRSLSLSFPEPLESGQLAAKAGVLVGCDLFINSDLLDSYDYVLVNFGDNVTHADVPKCDEVYLVTDYKLHNIVKLQSVYLAEDQCRFLVMRDKIGSKITPAYAIEVLRGLNINSSNIFELEDSYTDLENQLFCQYNAEIVFSNVSNSMRDFLVQILCNEFTSKEILAVFKKVSRRK